MKIRCIVIDDEPLSARDELGYLLSCADDVRLVGTAGSVHSGDEVTVSRGRVREFKKRLKL